MKHLIAMAYAPSKEKMDRIRAMLAEKACSNREIREELEICKCSANKYIRTLKESQEIYVSHWAIVGCALSQFYRFGNLPDAERPARKRNRSNEKKRPPRIGGTVESELERVREQIRSIEQSRKAQGLPPVPPDPLLAWIPRRDLREAA